MKANLETGGERLRITSAIPWVDQLIQEAAGEALNDTDEPSTVVVNIESSTRAYEIGSWEPLTRGAWSKGNEVVMENVCSSGFDLRLVAARDVAEFNFRWRPQLTGRAAAILLRTRFILLARAVLLQYPALWRASLRGRAPLHASGCAMGDLRPLLAGPGGVGKSTLIAQELAQGGLAISDNLCVSDGATAWGLVEPIRVEGGPGRSMPHGRTEAPLPGRRELHDTQCRGRDPAGSRRRRSPLFVRDRLRRTIFDRRDVHGRRAAPLLGFRRHAQPGKQPRAIPPAGRGDRAAARGAPAIGRDLATSTTGRETGRASQPC